MTAPPGDACKRSRVVLICLAKEHNGFASLMIGLLIMLQTYIRLCPCWKCDFFPEGPKISLDTCVGTKAASPNTYSLII